MHFFSNLQDLRDIGSIFASYEPQNYESFFTGSNSPMWHSRVVIIEDFDESNVVDDLAYAFFSKPEPQFYSKTSPKEKTYTHFSAPKAAENDVSADFASFFSNLFAKVLFGFESFFDSSSTKKESFASQKPSPSFDKMPKSTYKEMPKEAPKSHFQSKPASGPRPAPRNDAPHSAPKPAAPAANRAPAPARSADALASAPREVREHDKYKDNASFKRLAALYTRLNGNREEDATQVSAQETLKEIFNVDTYEAAKKQYKKLTLLLHPDKTLQMGLGTAAREYLSKLYTFASEYYALANS